MPRVAYERDVKLEELVKKIVACLGLKWIDPGRVYVVRSKGSSSSAFARIYGLPRVFQVSLGVDACYVIELISERFDYLPIEDKLKILLHELMHIPRTFSGGLRPHKHFASAKTIEKLYGKLLELGKDYGC
ncbi:MAG: metallopeptidase [Thermofilum sp.]|jgi:predicted metallopeptidase|nr:metallopeptidase [Thermofilum sp.]